MALVKIDRSHHHRNQQQPEEYPALPEPKGAGGKEQHRAGHDGSDQALNGESRFEAHAIPKLCGFPSKRARVRVPFCKDQSLCRLRDLLRESDRRPVRQNLRSRNSAPREFASVYLAKLSTASASLL